MEQTYPAYEAPCPVCRAPARSVAYLIVGMPVMDTETRAAMEKGHVALAGCLPPIRDWRDSDDAWSCRACHSEWVTREKTKTPLVYLERGEYVGDA